MKILYVEDEIAHVELTQRTLEENTQHEFVLLHTETIKEALQLVGSNPDIDLILTDLRLPDGSGIDLLKKVRERHSPPAVVLVTGQGDQEIAVAALKAGAADYLVKQSDYLHRLPIVLTNAIAQNRLLREQAALREAQARFRALVEQIPAAVYTDAADEHTSRLYISPQIDVISGYPAEEWINDPSLWKRLIHPDDKQLFLEEDKRTNITGEPFDLEYRLIARNGQSVWIHDRATLVRGENGKPVYWQGVLFDITKQKETQAVIRESEERFRRIFHASPIATCVVSLEEGRFLDANSEFLNLTGKSLENLVGHTSIELGFWDQQEGRDIFIQNLKEKGALKQVEFQYINVPNGPRDTIAYYELIELGGNPSVLAMFYDVTEQKKTQEAIKASESSYRGLFNSISQAIYIQDKEGRFLDVNDGAVLMYGYPREFFIGKTPEVLSAPGKNDLKELTKKIESAFLGEPQEFEFWGIRSDGEVFPKDVSLNKGTYFGQDVVIAIGQDITLRKQAEEVLEYQLKELSVLHSASSAAVQSSSEDELIRNITKITSQIYPEVCGILLLNQKGTILTPHKS